VADDRHQEKERSTGVHGVPDEPVRIFAEKRAISRPGGDIESLAAERNPRENNRPRRVIFCAWCSSCGRKEKWSYFLPH
jgi:hypothetical protein